MEVDRIGQCFRIKIQVFLEVVYLLQWLVRNKICSCYINLRAEAKWRLNMEYGGMRPSPEAVPQTVLPLCLLFGGDYHRNGIWFLQVSICSFTNNFYSTPHTYCIHVVPSRLERQHAMLPAWPSLLSLRRKMLAIC